MEERPEQLRPRTPGTHLVPGLSTMDQGLISPPFLDTCAHSALFTTPKNTAVLKAR